MSWYSRPVLRGGHPLLIGHTRMHTYTHSERGYICQQDICQHTLDKPVFTVLGLLPLLYKSRSTGPGCLFIYSATLTPTCQQQVRSNLHTSTRNYLTTKLPHTHSHTPSSPTTRPVHQSKISSALTFPQGRKWRLCLRSTLTTFVGLGLISGPASHHNSNTPAGETNIKSKN